MAKLIFNNVGTNTTNLIKAVGNSTDEAYVVKSLPSSQFNFIDISDSEYDAMFNGSKILTMSGTSPTFTDAGDHYEYDTPKDTFLDLLDTYKNLLTDIISQKPNHSKITAAQAALTWINALDRSSLGDTCDSLESQMTTAGKYVSFQAF